MATLGRAGALLALGCLFVPLAGCRRGAKAPPPTPPRAPGPARQFIADRKTHVYHRPDCPSLPPAERQVRLDRQMLEWTRSVHTPCEVCRPEGSPAGDSEAAIPEPTAEGPAPPPPTVEPETGP
jgi:hypothetical protein